MKIKLLLIIIIALSLVLPACSETTNEENVQTQNDTTVSVEESEVTTYELPVRNFDGYEFNVLWPDVLASGHFLHNELWVETSDGDLINDAVYSRNLSTEETYNVKIIGHTQNHSNIHTTIINLVMADEFKYDIFCTQIAQICNLGVTGILADYNDMEYYDTEQPWWNHATMDELSMNNKKFFGTGDIIISDDIYPYIIMFNNSKIDDYNLENPCEVVLNGNWTMDKMLEMAKPGSADIDGNGNYTYDDSYGILMVNSGTKAFFYGAGQNITGKNNEGFPYLVLNNERTADVINKIYNIVYTDNITFNGNKSQMSGLDHAQTTERIFSQNRGLFFVTSLIAVERLRAEETTFGLLPMPKYDSSQEEYYCVLNDLTLLGVPSNTPDLDRTSMIISAMSKYSMDTLTPAFYEMVLTEKYLRDAESVQMLELILQSIKVPNLGTVYDFGGLNSGIVNLIANGSTDFSSMYAANESKALTDIENFINSFTN